MGTNVGSVIVRLGRGIKTETVIAATENYYLGLGAKQGPASWREDLKPYHLREGKARTTALGLAFRAEPPERDRVKWVTILFSNRYDADFGLAKHLAKSLGTTTRWLLIADASDSHLHVEFGANPPGEPAEATDYYDQLGDELDRWLFRSFTGLRRADYLGEPKKLPPNARWISRTIDGRDMLGEPEEEEEDDEEADGAEELGYPFNLPGPLPQGPLLSVPQLMKAVNEPTQSVQLKDGRTLSRDLLFAAYVLALLKRLDDPVAANKALKGTSPANFARLFRAYGEVATSVFDLLNKVLAVGPPDLSGDPEAWREQVETRTADLETARKWAWYSALNGRPVDARNFLYQAFLPRPSPRRRSSHEAVDAAVVEACLLVVAEGRIRLVEGLEDRRVKIADSGAGPNQMAIHRQAALCAAGEHDR